MGDGEGREGGGQKEVTGAIEVPTFTCFLCDLAHLPAALPTRNRMKNIRGRGGNKGVTWQVKRHSRKSCTRNAVRTGGRPSSASGGAKEGRLEEESGVDRITTETTDRAVQQTGSAHMTPSSNSTKPGMLGHSVGVTERSGEMVVHTTDLSALGGLCAKRGRIGNDAHDAARPLAAGTAAACRNDAILVCHGELRDGTDGPARRDRKDHTNHWRP